jgi:hypothetical protein
MTKRQKQKLQNRIDTLQHWLDDPDCGRFFSEKSQRDMRRAIKNYKLMLFDQISKPVGRHSVAANRPKTSIQGDH